MNKNILYAFMAGATALGLASCNENSWNDHFLDGFEGGVVYDDAETGTYTLTEDNYATISNLLLAEATNAQDSTAAKAIKSNLFFNKMGVYPGQTAIIPFFNNPAFPYYLAADGSTVDVTFNEASNEPSELTAIAGATTYTVSAADYKEAWGSNEDFINGFAPMLTAEKQLPKILLANISDAEEGNYAVVTYNEASTNPIFNSVESVPENLDSDFANGDCGFTFEDVTLPEGSTYIWKLDTYKNDSYMKASGYVNKASRVSEGWLISPEFKVVGDAVLTFEQAWKNFKSVDNAKQEATVWVREKGGKWNQLTPSDFPLNTDYTFYPSGEISLSAYTDKVVQIGFLYKSSTESAGTWEVNKVKVQPKAAARSASRSLAAEVPTETKNAVYYFNGSAWSVADGVVALNPADYAAMGQSNNSLGEPEVYIPMYLKAKFPYAQSGAQEYVVYNKTKVNLFVYDGTNWSLNDNGLEAVVGRFQKQAGEWSFVKYVGKAIYDLFTGETIELDRSYLLVAESAYALPISKSKSYGYLDVEKVSISGTQIVLSNDAGSYTFSSAYVDNSGNKTACPEGQFLISDSNGRYLYMSGTYTSFNLRNTPVINDGEIDEAYLWTATREADGTWSISCVGSAQPRTFAFSISYNSYGAYETVSDGQVRPTLYMMSE